MHNLLMLKSFMLIVILRLLHPSNKLQKRMWNGEGFVIHVSERPNALDRYTRYFCSILIAHNPPTAIKHERKHGVFRNHRSHGMSRILLMSATDASNASIPRRNRSMSWEEKSWLFMHRHNSPLRQN